MKRKIEISPEIKEKLVRINERLQRASRFIRLPLEVLLGESLDLNFLKTREIQDVKFLEISTEISKIRLVFILIIQKHLLFLKRLIFKKLILTIIGKNMNTQVWTFQDFVLKRFFSSSYSFKLKIERRNSKIRVFVKDKKGKIEEIKKASENLINDFFLKF